MPAAGSSRSSSFGLVASARKLCIVAGRRDVANRMMSNVRQNLRYSGLCALLQAELPPEQVRVEE